MRGAGHDNSGGVDMSKLIPFCSKCDLPCEVLQIELFDWEEFWGAPVKRYYYEDVSECCEAEVFEDEDPED